MEQEYTLQAGETVVDGVRRIAYEQIDLAVAELHDEALGRHAAIHQVRKRCKKLRALLRVVRPVLGKTFATENAHVRDAARRLSDLRDATALLETYDALMARVADEVDRRPFGPIRRALTLRRRALAEDLDLDARVVVFLDDLHALRDRVASWPLDAEGFAALDGGLRKTYRRGRRTMAHAYAAPSPETFHAWRKRVKYHWYHVRLLHGLWPALMTTRGEALSHLASLLGTEHDLAVLHETLHAEPHRFGRIRHLPAFVSLLEQRRAELQAEARPLGTRLFAEKPDALSRRFEAFWQAWHMDDEETESEE